MPTSQWMTTRTAHQTSGIPKRTIIAAINRGDIKADKLPGLTGSFLIDPSHFEQWVIDRTAKAAS